MIRIELVLHVGDGDAGEGLVDLVVVHAVHSCALQGRSDRTGGGNAEVDGGDRMIRERHNPRQRFQLSWVLFLETRRNDEIWETNNDFRN